MTTTPASAPGDASASATLTDFEQFHAELTQLRADRTRLAQCLAHRSQYVTNLERQVAAGTNRCEVIAEKHPRLRELWKVLRIELDLINSEKKDANHAADH